MADLEGGSAGMALAPKPAYWPAQAGQLRGRVVAGWPAGE